MPVHVRSFYNKKDAGSDTESESRWGYPKVTSSVVVPPSDIASTSVLSAPSSGFSSPKGSVRTSEHSSAVDRSKKQLFTFPNLLKPSRFVNALKRKKVTDVQSQTNQHAVDLITQLQRKNDLRLPVSNTVEKCDIWMSGCGLYLSFIFFSCLSLVLRFSFFLTWESFFYRISKRQFKLCQNANSGRLCTKLQLINGFKQ